jgi:hypothetical protein
MEHHRGLLLRVLSIARMPIGGMPMGSMWRSQWKRKSSAPRLAAVKFVNVMLVDAFTSM